MAAPAPTSPTKRRTLERLSASTRSEIEATGSFTAERVAERAGSSVATFYTYFPTKADALNAAFDRVLADLIDFCEGAFQVEALAEQGLSTFCETLANETIRFFKENEKVFRLALAALPENPSLRALYRNCEKTTLAHQKQWVAEAQQRGHVRNGQSAEIARGLLVLLQGINNPSVLRTRRNDALRDELGRAIFLFLSP